jgi:hypothetical protein
MLMEEPETKLEISLENGIHFHLSQLIESWIGSARTWSKAIPGGR